MEVSAPLGVERISNNEYIGSFRHRESGVLTISAPSGIDLGKQGGTSAERKLKSRHC